MASVKGRKCSFFQIVTRITNDSMRSLFFIIFLNCIFFLKCAFSLPLTHWISIYLDLMHSLIVA